MGLDIYTYTAEQHEKMAEYSAKYDDNEDYDWESDPDKENRRILDAQIEWGGTTVKSKEYPDNINERRYLRSSYNDSGFNSRVPMVTGNPKHDYYGILAPLTANPNEEYQIKVDNLDKIAEARANALEVVAALEDIADKPQRFSMDVTVVNPFNREVPDTAEDAALALANEELDKENPFGGAWTSGHGFFAPDGLNVVAIVPGRNLIGALCVHVIYEQPLHHSYLESAKVLVEFLDELAELVKSDGVAYVHWSG